MGCARYSIVHCTIQFGGKLSPVFTINMEAILHFSTDFESAFTLAGTKGGEGGGWMPLPSYKVFLEFFQDDLSCTPAVFRSCAHIPYTHFGTRLVTRNGCEK